MTVHRTIEVATAAPYAVTVGENLLQDVADAVPESAMRAGWC